MDRSLGSVHGLTPVSIIGAATSLLVTPLLIYVLFKARNEGRFATRIFVAAMLFESLFLVAYMTFLSFQPGRNDTITDPLDVTLGAMHGVLALIVFIGFWTLLPISLQHYRRGRNLYRESTWLTWSATALRIATLATGEALFVLHLIN